MCTLDQKKTPALQGQSHSCVACSESFDSFQKMSLHAFKAHAIKSVWRLYVGESSVCEVCMHQFHTRDRLLNHIRYRSKVCKHNMHIRGPICNEEQSKALDSAAAAANAALYSQGLRSHSAREPAYRIAGPLLPVLLPPGVTESSHSPLGKGRNY